MTKPGPFKWFKTSPEVIRLKEETAIRSGQSVRNFLFKIQFFSCDLVLPYSCAPAPCGPDNRGVLISPEANDIRKAARGKHDASLYEIVQIEHISL